MRLWFFWIHVLGLLLNFSPLVWADQGVDPSLSVFPGGMGIHTMAPAPRRLIELMPRHLDRNGHFVLTPGIGVIYRNNGYQFQSLFIKDSFSNSAGALTGGYEFETGYSWLDLGASLGVYVRESPRGCYEFSDGTYCYTESNEIPLLYHSQLGNNYLDIAIMPLFNLGFHLPVTKTISAELILNTAVFLSFVTFGLRFEL